MLVGSSQAVVKEEDNLIADVEVTSKLKWDLV